MVNLGGLSTITAGNLACFPALCLGLKLVAVLRTGCRPSRLGHRSHNYPVFAAVSYFSLLTQVGQFFTLGTSYTLFRTWH